MSYRFDVSHPQLGKYRVVTGATQWEAQQKAAAQLAQWEDMWRRRVAADQARFTREAAAKANVDRKQLALAMTTDAERTIDTLESILLIGLRTPRIDWDSFKDCRPFSKPKTVSPQPVPPTPSSVPPKPNPNDAAYRPGGGIMQSLLPAKRLAAQKEASARYAVALTHWTQTRDAVNRKNVLDQHLHRQNVAVWQADCRRRETLWEQERAEFLSVQSDQHRMIDLQRSAYFAGEPPTVETYFRQVLALSNYPACLPGREYQCVFVPETRILVVDSSLPNPDHLPSIKAVRFIQSRNELQDVALSASRKSELYDSVIYQTALRTLAELFTADIAKIVDAIVLNGWVESVDKSSGILTRKVVASVHVSRAEFVAINLQHVDPKQCFRSLKGVSAAKLMDLVAVRPVLHMKTDDERFVASYDVVESLSESTNLAAMDWEDFEHLIRELFEKEFASTGGDVKVTRASRDHGVDAVAFDPDVIRGGKIVIQAKRYTHTVGVSAVRDLYGTVLNEGATKGILVTTSDYGSDSIAFAKDKPLTLLNGSELLFLLQRHGFKARIDIGEARLLLRGESAGS